MVNGRSMADHWQSHQTRAGQTLYVVHRAELESLPGYRAEAGGRRGRACCPIHGGNNPTALVIDWQTGWGRCWNCDARIRVADSATEVPDWRNRHAHTPPMHRYVREKARSGPPCATMPENGPPPMAASPRALEAAIDAATARLTDSPAVAYLASRGISLATAQTLRLGWGTRGKLAGRVVFPLTDPAGRPTSAMGRAITATQRPKYTTLPTADGYRKTLVNGGAVTAAQRVGAPLILVEGPLDAAACVAAGLPHTAAICGAAYAHPEHFADLATVILALDSDDAGQAGRRALWLALISYGVEVLLLPAAALDGAKDLAEYWQRHQRMPAILVDGASARRAAALTYLPGLAEPHASTVPPCTPSPEADVDPALAAEAAAIAVELACDPAALDAFVADLERNASHLTAADAGAARHAVRLALAAINSRL